MKLFENIKAKFASIKARIKNEFRPAKENVQLASASKYPQLIERGKRWRKVIRWCTDFNVRTGHIVSAKSPVSIYYKTHPKRRKCLTA